MDDPPLRLENGTGGFTPEGDYLVRVKGHDLPPPPWSNVVANARRWIPVTPSGEGDSPGRRAAFFHRLTRRGGHRPGERRAPARVIYLRDEEDRGALVALHREIFWPAGSPGPGALGAPLLGGASATCREPPSSIGGTESRGRLVMGMARGRTRWKLSGLLHLRNEGGPPPGASRLTAYAELGRWAVTREVTQAHLQVGSTMGRPGRSWPGNPFDFGDFAPTGGPLWLALSGGPLTGQLVIRSHHLPGAERSPWPTRWRSPAPTLSHRAPGRGRPDGEARSLRGWCRAWWSWPPGRRGARCGCSLGSGGRPGGGRWPFWRGTDGGARSRGDGGEPGKLGPPARVGAPGDHAGALHRSAC